ncbi:MAG: putative nucleotidyltransferase with HDIG domain [Psychromonas sp.]|jgi:putative nucleotidyltransferase with HDIG domain|uniref:HD domain-containing phosphohydrolase n=1 Tax=Psychromonas sp. TaxID=1884585 RepID=UPI0039E34C27
MNSKFESENYLSKLKAAAKKQLLSSSAPLNGIDLNDSDIDNSESLIHELHTHQIELELQNNELQETQIKLYESLKKYSDLFDFAPNGYMTINPKGLIVETNKTSSKLLTSPVHKMLNKPLSDFIVREDQDVYYHFRRKLINTTKYQICELRIKTANDLFMFVQLTASIDSSIDGIDGQFRLTLTDISELKLAQLAQEKHSEQLNKALINTIHSLGTIVEVRDPYTFGHQKRVAKLALLIAKKMGLPEMQQEGIMHGAHIHDIGKINVPAEILNCPRQLTKPEFEIIKTHPQVGYDIIENTEFPWPIKEMILQHHERLDGSGYPYGLKGDQIILEAQIIAVADVVEAINSHRPYRAALGLNIAIAEIQKNKNILYNGDVVDTCIEIIREPVFEF